AAAVATATGTAIERRPVLINKEVLRNFSPEDLFLFSGPMAKGKSAIGADHNPKSSFSPSGNYFFWKSVLHMNLNHSLCAN
ncbi:MAG: hypothetical protein R3350_02190, partial [Saprospiraceae bacterium]|nr:hypothetical protein [Saprospiraceae bacterium]